MRLLKLLGIPLIWGGSLLGALSLHHVAALDQGSVCGPWGCGPPNSALIAIHASWAIALWPPLFWLGWRYDTSVSRRLSSASCLIGLLGIAGIVFWQFYDWLPQQRTSDYIVQRCGFAVMTAIDLPVIELLVGGIVLKVASRWKSPDTRSGTLSEVPERMDHSASPSAPETPIVRDNRRDIARTTGCTSRRW